MVTMFEQAMLEPGRFLKMRKMFLAIAALERAIESEFIAFGNTLSKETITAVRSIIQKSPPNSVIITLRDQICLIYEGRHVIFMPDGSIKNWNYDEGKPTNVTLDELLSF